MRSCWWSLKESRLHSLRWLAEVHLANHGPPFRDVNSRLPIWATTSGVRRKYAQPTFKTIRGTCIELINRIRQSLFHSRTMPPALHPRSRQTGALFTGTLAFCFLVVGMPHILPCPVNPKQYADTIEGPDGQPMRRRRKRKQISDETGSEGESAEAHDALMAESKKTRECPVPKPGGLLGQVMGFKENENQKPPQVIVERVQAKRTAPKQQEASETP
jgi:cytochrome c oxidase assembly factor 2